MPASLEEVEGLVRKGVPPAQILEMVGEDCLGFHPDALSSARLQAAGATDLLISQLSGICVDSAAVTPRSVLPPPLPPPQPPSPLPPPPSTSQSPLPPSQAPAPDLSLLPELFVGGRLEIEMSGSTSPPRALASLEAMTPSRQGWRVGVGAAGAFVSSQNSPSFALLIVDGRVSYSLYQDSTRLGFRAYAAVGTLFNVDVLDPGFRTTSGLSMDVGPHLRLCLDLSKEWRPETLHFEPQATMLSFGLSWNLVRTAR